MTSQVSIFPVSVCILPIGCTCHRVCVPLWLPFSKVKVHIFQKKKKSQTSLSFQGPRKFPRSATLFKRCSFVPRSAERFFPSCPFGGRLAFQCAKISECIIKKPWRKNATQTHIHPKHECNIPPHSAVVFVVWWMPFDWKPGRSQVLGVPHRREHCGGAGSVSCYLPGLSRFETGDFPCISFDGKIGGTTDNRRTNGPNCDWLTVTTTMWTTDRHNIRVCDISNDYGKTLYTV